MRFGFAVKCVHTHTSRDITVTDIGTSALRTVWFEVSIHTQTCVSREMYTQLLTPTQTDTSMT